MSHLDASINLNMNEVLISVWFRIPASSMAIKDADAVGFYWGFRVLLGVVPLITWGPQIFGTEGDVSAYLPPSYIGVRSGMLSDSGKPILDLHIQTNDMASVDPDDPGSASIPQFLGNSSADSSHDAAGQPEIGNLDEWHHLLLSWNLGGGNSSGPGGVGQSSTIYCAIDDAAKTGANLPCLNGDEGEGGGENEMITFTCDQCAGSRDHTMSVGFSAIPTNPMCIPAPATLLHNAAFNSPSAFNANQEVELGSLQIFCGQSLDVGLEVNRRLFIDDTGGPVDPSEAEMVLGTPDVRFVASTDWISGTNTGSAGNFTPVGTIGKFETNPKLGT